MPSFANPVSGYLHPPGWVRPPGSTDFRVTVAFGVIDAAHPAPKGHLGIDCGDADADADPVHAAAAGTVNLVRDLDGCVEITHAGGWRTAYVHMRLPLEVTLGQVIAEGQVIGHQGKTYASAVHLHFETKQLVNGVWVHRDPWPLLRQNQEDSPMVPVPAVQFTHLVNKKTSVIATAANFRAERRLDAAVIKQYPQGTVFLPVASANDGSPAGGVTPTLWYGGFLFDDSPTGFVFGWFHSSVVGSLIDNVASGGFTQADMDKATAASSAAAKAKTKTDAEAASTAAIRAI